MDQQYQPKEQLGPVGAIAVGVLTLAILFGFSQCSRGDSSPRTGHASEFPGPWQDALTDAAPVEISIALTSAHADCRHAWYRMHASNRSWARVQCSRDGETWTLWGVRWDRAAGPTATGPLAPDPLLSPPRLTAAEPA